MKIGLALSGGGARGFAHLGIAQFLYEQNIKPDIISGTSAGAIAGAFLAAGYLPKRTLEIISDINFLKFFRPAMSWSGLVSLEKISGLLLEYFPDNSFNSLKIPLIISTTNYSKGENVNFDSGELIKPLLASASIPVIFKPIMMGEDSYVDGGITNNMPANLLHTKADFIIGVNCNPVGPANINHNMKEMLERSLMMAINYQTKEQAQLCDLFIEPYKLSDYKVFSLSKAQEIYDIGYESVKVAFSKLDEDHPLKQNFKTV
ncbi:patatin-like phospholipase family protein [Marivirga arenosa]|uniref:Patatin-like phospholipase family protein n=1 Tax=Marivirga arenosa TaxID=3059076 RepID=A0AA49GDN9_9BACT|nr:MULTISPECIES: patatin-like phospholipase family protein [unclassified Marivirga]WKK80556.2 patatin-like phospholipase family protein [Marivirga sp. BKB1-2]WKK84459.2 patatin-like phospholipase family protein [Marivirga sp. ABR2-2]